MRQQTASRARNDTESANDRKLFALFRAIVAAVAPTALYGAALVANGHFRDLTLIIEVNTPSGNRYDVGQPSSCSSNLLQKVLTLQTRMHV